jgi:hypothetical protein
MKRCIFCKSKDGITKEHIFNKWYRELNEVPLESLNHISYKHKTKRFVRGKELEDVEIEKKSTRKHSINTLVNGSVCGKCNNVFLNKIDDEAREVVVRILKSKSEIFSMSGNEFSKLSRWAYKTVLTLTNSETINYRELIPDLAYKDFYLTREVPDDVIISLARLDSSSYKSEPLWLISQNFMFEFPQNSRYAQQVLMEDKYLLNTKRTFPPKVYYLMRECTKESFHVILNLNGILIRIAYIPCTDIFSYKFSKEEVLISPKVIGFPEYMLKFESMMALWQNLKLNYY